MQGATQPPAKRARASPSPSDRFPAGINLRDMPKEGNKEFVIEIKQGLVKYSHGSQTGKLSPLSTLTYGTRKLGVPQGAKFFLFAHPPLPHVNTRGGQPPLLKQGGFMYFDSCMKLLQVKEVDGDKDKGLSLLFWKQHKKVETSEEFSERFGPGFGGDSDQQIAWVMPGEAVNQKGDRGEYGGFLYKHKEDGEEVTRWAPLRKYSKLRKTPPQPQAEATGVAQSVDLIDLDSFFGEEAGDARAILEFDTWAKGKPAEDGLRLMEKRNGAWEEVQGKPRTIESIKSHVSTEEGLVLVVANRLAMDHLNQNLKEACSKLPRDLGTLQDDCCRRDVGKLQPALSVKYGAKGVRFGVSEIPMAVWSVRSNKGAIKKFEDVAGIALDTVAPDHGVRAHVAYMLAAQNDKDPVFKALEKFWSKTSDGGPAEPNAEQLTELAEAWSRLPETFLTEYNSHMHMLEQDREKAAVYTNLLATRA